MRFAFADTAAVVDVPDSRDFLSALRAAAADWPFSETDSTAEPVATVRLRGGKYEIDIPGEEPLEATAVSAACSAMVDVVGAHVAENPNRLCFHSGAAVFAGRLVVFPSRAHAGKSTLISRLAASGRTIFSDDILPVSEDDANGISLGIAPRLRLPLPQGSSRSIQKFVWRHEAASDGRYLYLKLPGGRLAPRNASAPLGALVLLDRRTDGPASLARASRSAILQSLIVQNFARAAPAGALLDRLHRIMDRLPRLVLRYSDLEDANALLEETFASWPPRLADLPQAAAPEEEAVLAWDDQVPKLDPELAFPVDMLLVRSATVRLHAVDGEVFLADAEGFSIHRLNATGAGLWNLLAEPTSQNEAVEALCTAFPDAERAIIARDVARLLEALAAGRFIAPATR